MTVYAGAVIRRRSTRISKIILLALALMVTLMMVILPMAGGASSASAGWFENLTCGTDLGTSTSYQTTDDTLANDELMSNGGKYSAMDIYKNSLRWTTYNGYLGDDEDKLNNFDMKSLKGASADGKEKNNVKEASDTMRVGPQCIGRWATTSVANALLGLTGLITSVMSAFVSYAVNPNVICPDPSKPHMGCVNLLPILGGNGAGQQGIIGALYNGLFISLAGLVAIIVAIWMIIKAVKGEARTAIFGIIWTVLSFALFVVVLTHPLMLAEAPMKASTTLGSCMVEALNGHSCVSSASSSPPAADSSQTPANQLCLINPKNDVTVDQRLALDSRMSTCKLWKAFALEPWSEGQFGMSYESLETATTDLIGKSPSKDSLDYWKSMKTSLEADSTNSLCKSTKSQQSNIGLYQLDLMTDVHDCKGAGGGSYHSNTKTAQDPGVYNDWYYLVDIMSQARTDTGTGADNISHSWNTWSGSSSGVRNSLGLVAIIASLLAATIIIPSSIYALGYMFIGTILTVFAPMFMLIGLHPTVGRKMFLGWLELEIGAILKYFFSVLWVSVVVEVFGAILGSSTSSMITLAFVIAMAATLKAYRKELTQIFGNIDLGGKKLSNAIGQRFSSAAGKAKGLAGAYAGGAAAGLINGQGGVKSRLTSMHDMAKFQVMQQGKYMGGAVGNAFMSADKIHDNRRHKMMKEAEGQNALAQAQADKAEYDASLSRQATANEASQGWTGFNLEDPNADQNAKTRRDHEIATVNADPKTKGLDEVDQAGAEARKEWRERVDNAEQLGLVDSNNPDGVYRSTNAKDIDANEAAYVRNQAERSKLRSSATVVTDDNGKQHFKFANADDKQRYNSLSRALEDPTALAAHEQYRKDEDDYAHLAARDEFNRQKTAGNIDASINSMEDLHQAGVARDERIDDIQSKYDHTVAAIASNRKTVSLEKQASTLHDASEHLHEVNRQVLDRSEGATYSSKEQKALEQRGRELRSDIGGGGTGATVMNNADYLNRRSRVYHKLVGQ